MVNLGFILYIKFVIKADIELNMYIFLICISTLIIIFIKREYIERLLGLLFAILGSLVLGAISVWLAVYLLELLEEYFGIGKNVHVILSAASSGDIDYASINTVIFIFLLTICLSLAIFHLAIFIFKKLIILFDYKDLLAFFSYYKRNAKLLSVLIGLLLVIFGFVPLFLDALYLDSNKLEGAEEKFKINLIVWISIWLVQYAYFIFKDANISNHYSQINSDKSLDKIRVSKEKIVGRVLIKKIFKHLGITVAIIIITLILGILFPNNSESISGISSWILICYLMLGYFNIVFKLSEKREASSLKRRSNNTRKDLYQWLANVSWDNVSIYELLKVEKQTDLISNLKKIKNVIRKQVGNNVYDYYLLKDYLEYHAKHNFLNTLRKTIGIVFLGALGTAFTKLRIIDKIYQYIENGRGDSGTLEQVEIIVQIGVMSLASIIVYLFIHNELTKEKRRIDLLKSIVDTIIKEKVDDKET